MKRRMMMMMDRVMKRVKMKRRVKMMKRMSMKLIQRRERRITTLN
jgi:hypothetical protein